MTVPLPPAPPSSSQTQSQGQQGKGATSSYRRKRATAGRGKSAQKRGEALTSEASQTNARSTARGRIATANTIASTLSKTLVEGVELKRPLKGQAGINAFLNQHMVHMHSDNATCPLSDPFRSDYDQRIVSFMREIKEQRETQHTGLGRSDISHEERRKALLNKRTNEEVYKALLGEGPHYHLMKENRSDTETDAVPTRTIRRLEQHEQLHAHMHVADFVARPFDDLLRRHRAHERFLHAGRTVLLRLRVDKRIQYFKQYGRQVAARLLQVQHKQQRQEASNSGVTREDEGRVGEGAQTEQPGAVLACHDLRQLANHHVVRPLQRTDPIALSIPLTLRAPQRAPVHAPLAWGVMSLQVPSTAEQLGYTGTASSDEPSRTNRAPSAKAKTGGSTRQKKIGSANSSGNTNGGGGRNKRINEPKRGGQGCCGLATIRTTTNSIPAVFTLEDLQLHELLETAGTDVVAGES